MLNKQNIKDIYPLSPMQEGMFYHSLHDPDSTAYFQQMLIRLRGRLDVDTFHAALDKLVARHDILRTIFIHKNTPQPLQIVQKEHKVDFNFEDISHLSSDEELKYIQNYKTRDRSNLFNLSKQTPFRAALLKCANDEWVFINSFHHILMDGWCINIVFNELIEYYESLLHGSIPNLSPVPAFSTYIKYLDNLDKRTSAEYWKNYLSGYENIVKFPVSNHQNIQTEYKLETLQLELSHEESSGISSLANTHQVTLNTLIQSIWGILLSKYNNQNDVVFGTTVTNRPAEINGIERMVGLFINTVPVRIKIDRKSSIGDILQSAHRQSFEALDHVHLSLADIQSHSTLKSQLINHILVFENLPQDRNEQEKSQAYPIQFIDSETFEQTHYDLELSVFPGELVNFRFGFNSNKIPIPDMERILNHLHQLIKSVLTENLTPIGKLNILTAAEAENILTDFNTTSTIFPLNKNITQLFEEQVVNNPEKTAAICENKKLSYNELNLRANTVGYYLNNNCNLSKNDVVGIYMNRSESLLIAILGVLKAGVAYLPLDPTHPSDRLNYILDKTSCRYIITDINSSDIHIRDAQLNFIRFDEIFSENDSNPNLPIEPHNLAYVIFTSGSTGKPKGVKITHQNVLCFNSNIGTKLDINDSDTLLALTTISFDISVLELICSLLNGLTVVIGSNELSRSPERILSTITDEHITALQVTPSHLRMLFESDSFSLLENLRTLIIGGEPLPEDLFNAVIKLNIQNIYNVYGPTEATVWAASQQLNYASLNIGKPLNNYQIFILSEDLEPLPVNAPGQIFIGGLGVSPGYYKQPELTESRFIYVPTIHNEPIYATGDFGKWTPDGEIQFLGRLDNQVKIRGFRVELDEIEGCLNRVSGVQDCAVTARKNTGSMDLVAYYTGPEKLKFNDVHNQLGKSLPEYMLPGRLIHLDSFPLNLSGKIDRLALPDPGDIAVTKKEFVEPFNNTQAKLAEIYKNILQLQNISIYDNFYELGGHSLKATRIISRINKEFGVELSFQEFFQNPTIAGIEHLLLKRDPAKFVTIEPQPSQGDYSLSHAQKRLWILDNMTGGSGAYLMAGAYEIEGEFNKTALIRAFQDLTDRHESLRTCFITVNGRQHQRIIPKISFELEEYDLSEKINDEAEIREIIKNESEISFDLSQAPLMRVKLFTLSNNRYITLIVMHHIISDAWSLDVLGSEYVRLYRYYNEGIDPELPELRIQYHDYAAWQLKQLDSGILDREKDYWLAKFSSELPVLNLPTDFVRPREQSFDGNTLNFELPDDLSRDLVSFGRRYNVSLFTVLVSLINSLLYRYTRQEKIIIGTPVHGRNHPDLENQIGFFVNTLALMNSIKGSYSFEQIMKNVNQTINEAYDNGFYPFDMLIDELDLEKDLSRPPLFNIMCVLQEEDDNDQSLDEIGIKEYHLDHTTARFDITFEFKRKAERIELGLNYCSALFKESTISRLAEHFQILSRSAIDKTTSPLNSLEVLSAKERNKVVTEYNNTFYENILPETITSAFEHQVKKTPDNQALIFADKSYTYSELNCRAAAVANYLKIKLGVKSQSPVGVMIPRSDLAVIGLLGVMKSGAVYVPIDPDYPLERVNEMLKISECDIIITDAKYLEHARRTKASEIINIEEIQECLEYTAPEIHGEDLAYLIFTSGSTGKPKGVEIEHRSFMNMIEAQINEFSIKPDDRVLQFANLSFDASISEIFMALLSGAALVPIENEVVNNLVDFRNFLNRKNVTVATLPPSYLNTLERTGLDGIKTLITAGEQSIIDDARYYCRWLNYFNAYGPTESSVCASIYKVDPDVELVSIVPIGKPINNTKLFILDDRLQPLPIGIQGEIYIGGAGLARGYRGMPELTARQFIDSPLSELGRIYKTGDRGVWLDTGDIKFNGREDHQIKIRGYRIEPEDIENALLKYPKISNTVVVAYRTKEKTQDIVAYYVSENIIQPEKLRRHLTELLPNYMIPAYFVQIDEMPLTVNGKIDRSKLPKPELKTPDNYIKTAPRNDLESKIYSIWQEVLSQEDISVFDNFFNLGGNSLKAIQMVSRVSEKIVKGVNVKMLFSNPTIAELAGALDKLIENAPVIIETPRIIVDNAATIDNSGAIRISQEPLENLIEREEIPPVDAAALGYFTESFLSSVGYTRDELAGKAHNNPILTDIIETGLGRIAFITLPRSTSNIYDDKDDFLALIKTALELAGKTGAKTVSLTGLIPSATNLGRDVTSLVERNQLLLSVSTGHATTAATILLAIENILEISGRDSSREIIGFLGLGSVGSIICELTLSLLPHPKSIILCDLYSKAEDLEKIKEKIRSEYNYSGDIIIAMVTEQLPDEFYNSSLIVGATNVPDVLEIPKLRPGCLIIDDSGPHCFKASDAIKRFESEEDILFTEGGVLMSPDHVKVTSYLPDYIHEALKANGIDPFEDFQPEEITGCILSGLLSTRFDTILPTSGRVSISDCISNHKLLSELGFKASDLHIERYRLNRDAVSTFRERFFDI